MTTRPKVAFVYNKRDEQQGLLATAHRNPNTRAFFMSALPLEKRIDYTPLACGPDWDVNELRAYDAVILRNMVPTKHWGTKGPSFAGMGDIKIPKLLKQADLHDITRSDWAENCREFGVNVVFSWSTKSTFRQCMGDEFRFEHIVHGIDPAAFDIPPPQPRVKDQVLLAGVAGRSLRPEVFKRYYAVRAACGEVPGVIWSNPTAHAGHMFPPLLRHFQAGIAACSGCVVAKYYEMAAAGMMTFMEATPENAVDELGFVDGKNCRFINADNYAERIAEYLETADDPEWAGIAERGQRFVLDNYSMHVQAKKLVDIILELI